jgi:hypothetical protein
MKNFEEFKGNPFRLEFDPASGSFFYKPLASKKAPIVEKPVLFRPKPSPQTQAQAEKKIRRLA